LSFLVSDCKFDLFDIRIIDFIIAALFDRLPAYLPVCPSICPSVRPFARLPVYLPVCLTARLLARPLDRLPEPLNRSTACPNRSTAQPLARLPSARRLRCRGSKSVKFKLSV
jgi:hypothetical protein